MKRKPGIPALSGGEERKGVRQGRSSARRLRWRWAAPVWAV